MNEFTNKKKKGMSLGLLITLVSILVTSTLAWFAIDEYASKYTQMSGKVHIEAVGKATEYASIENTLTRCNLDIALEDGYEVLIPGMQMDVIANVKVHRSTTKPLVRALFSVVVRDLDNINMSDMDVEGIASNMYFQMKDIVMQDNDWYFHSDGYYYYIGDNTPGTSGADTVLKEVDATNRDTVVHFIDKPIKFPTNVTSSYSGLKIDISIRFQAIQNYIPDDDGLQVTNTIDNSQKIFSDFSNDIQYDITTAGMFTVTTDGTETTLKAKAGMVLPENVVLPTQTDDGREITTLSASVFQGNVTTKNIIIPETYTKIEAGAFQNSSPISVDLSKSSITEIPDLAFYNSQITNIIMPNTITKIGSEAFRDTANLKSINLPESLTTIGNKAFYNSGFNSIYIPKNVETIGNASFYTALVQIEVDDANPYWRDENKLMLISSAGHLNTVAKSGITPVVNISDDIVSLGELSLASTRITTINIGKNMETIGTEAFFCSYLSSITVNSNNPNFLSENNNTMYSKDRKKLWVTTKTLTNFVMSESLNRIDPYAFGVNDNYSITTLTLNSTWSNTVFSTCKALQNIIIPASNKNFYSDGRALYSADKTKLILYYCGNTATSYTVLSTTEVIGHKSLSNAKYLESIVLPEGLKQLESQSFYYSTNLKDINIPSTLTNIGSYAFNATKITSITIHNSVVNIGNVCFRSCSQLVNAELYNKGIIGSQMFVGCSALKTVTIGEDVTSMGSNFFQNCSSLETIKILASTPPTLITSNIFLGASANYKIYVPDGSLNLYKTASYWSSFASHIYPISTYGL